MGAPVPANSVCVRAVALMPSDEELMQRTGEGDHGAYRELVDRHISRALAWGQRITGSPSQAEDVVQEAFLRVWTNAAQWRPDGARFTTWLYRVVLNLCIDRSRRRPFEPWTEAEQILDPAPGPAEQVHHDLVAQLVASAVTRLPAQQRAALILCHYEGLSNAETAQVLQISLKAVESLLVRARRKLRAQLTPNLLQER